MSLGDLPKPTIDLLADVTAHVGLPPWLFQVRSKGTVPRTEELLKLLLGLLDHISEIGVYARSRKGRLRPVSL